MQSSTWSNAETIEFLELYEAERLIWDPRDKNHKMKHKVMDAWKRISEHFGVSVEELKLKKKSLMATFRPLLKKKVASILSGADADEVFQPVWFAYETMERFLGTLYNVEEIKSEERPFENDTTTPPIKRSKPIEIQYNRSTIQRPMKRHMDLSVSDVVGDADKKINDSLATLNRILQRKKGEEDDCDVYASLLAKRLRKYPNRMRDVIMYKIDGLLLENPPPDEGPSSADPLQAETTYLESP